MAIATDWTTLTDWELAAALAEIQAEIARRKPPVPVAVTFDAAYERFQERLGECSFFPKTNETYYPAKWSYGEGAGDASTSCHYDGCTQLAADRALLELAEENDVTVPDLGTDWAENMGSRAIAREIAAAINEAVADEAGGTAASLPPMTADEQRLDQEELDEADSDDDEEEEESDDEDDE